MLIAHLGRPGGDPSGFAALRTDFEARNPGYRLAWHPATTALAAATAPVRIAFVHGGGTPDATVGAQRSALRVGDVVALRPGEALASAAPLDLLVFAVPVPLGDDVPGFLRPDDDPLLTDTPGGCATAADAYRRVVLTWLRDNGPYRFDGLNAHRVRMVDSFSHYHPTDGGFDELYLVQDVAPGAVLWTSDRVHRIERPDDVEPDELDGLLTETTVAVGDLVCVGRGDMHRAVGGVLAHVITVPGFVPGQEIGVDHHLRAIAERLGRPLPYHAAAADRPVVK
ncbi:MAG: hypothetical protein IPM29_06635 [Planctomycetes bacterium]|nr:hypothetical protein [Planctomycetota bacterium]